MRDYQQSEQIKWLSNHTYAQEVAIVLRVVRLLHDLVNVRPKGFDLVQFLERHTLHIRAEFLDFSKDPKQVCAQRVLWKRWRPMSSLDYSVDLVVEF